MSPRCRCVLLTAALACGGAEPTATQPPGTDGSVPEGVSAAPAVESANAAAASEDARVAAAPEGAPAATATDAREVGARERTEDLEPPIEAAEDTPLAAANERGAAAWRATYSVPVPAELEPYASFELRDLRFRQRGEEWALDYTLPALLLGESTKLSFRGSLDASGVYELSGDAGTVTCIAEADALRCDEVLVAVEFDRNKLERALAELPADENEARWDIAERFADDPIGVLRFAR